MLSAYTGFGFSSLSKKPKNVKGTSKNVKNAFFLVKKAFFACHFRI